VTGNRQVAFLCATLVLIVSGTGCSEGRPADQCPTPKSGLDQVVFESVPYTSAHNKPDHTAWGINMRKIARIGDRVYSYYIDNRDYCQVTPSEPWIPDCAVTGGTGWSHAQVLIKRADEPWAELAGLRAVTVRPGNLLVDPVSQCLHMFVFAPHTSLSARQSDGIGSLRHYYVSATDPTLGWSAETIVAQPPSPGDSETANIRVGASIAPDGRIVVAWGSYTDGNSMNVRVGDGAGCGKSWSSPQVEAGLQHQYYYPRVHVGGLVATDPASAVLGEPTQQHYTAILAQMDEELTDCDGEPTESIYRKARYWEDSRDGDFAGDTLVNLWSPCNPSYDRVNHTEAYIDSASRTHVIFTKLANCASSSGGCAAQQLEHWYKPGDSFHHGAGPGQWTKKILLNWGAEAGDCPNHVNLGVNEVRLVEADTNGDGEQELFYVAVSNAKLYLARFDETRDFLCSNDLHELAPAEGWPSHWGGLRAYVAGRGGGTLLAERFVDILLFSRTGSDAGGDAATATRYIRIPDEVLPELLGEVAPGEPDAGPGGDAAAGGSMDSSVCQRR